MIKKISKYGYIEFETGNDKNIWFTSDHHFFHKNIIRLCNRPFSDVQEMTEKMIENWNNLVKPGDFVFNLGDFCWSGSSDEWIKLMDKLNGHQILIIGNHDCVSSKTRIFTKRGWLSYEHLTNNDMVLSFNSNTKCCEWQSIIDIIIKDSDYIYTQRGQSLEIEATEKHRHLLYDPDIDDYIYKKTCELDHYTNDKLKVIHGAKISNNDYNIEDKDIELVAWLMSDGGYNEKYDNENIPQSMCIYQSKEDNYTDIENLLNKFQFEYSIYDRDRSNETRYIKGKKIKNVKPEKIFSLLKDFRNHIYKYLPNNKILPNWIYDLSYRQLKIFIETLLKADGSFYKDRRKDSCWQLNDEKYMLEQFQPLFCMCGYRCTLVEDNRGDYKLNITTDIFTNVKIQHRRFKNEKYNNKVWCITTPLSNFLVELNGKVYFTGNCRKCVEKVENWYKPRENDCRAVATKLWLVRERIEVRYNGNRYILDHFPQYNWNGKYHFVKHLHGHIHEKDNEIAAVTSYNVSVERNNYSPISLKNVNILLDKQFETGMRNFDIRDLFY